MRTTSVGDMLAASMEKRPNPRERVSANTERLLESFDENVVVNAVESGAEIQQTEQRDFTAISSGINVRQQAYSTRSSAVFCGMPTPVYIRRLQLWHDVVRVKVGYLTSCSATILWTTFDINV